MGGTTNALALSSQLVMEICYYSRSLATSVSSYTGMEDMKITLGNAFPFAALFSDY